MAGQYRLAPWLVAAGVLATAARADILGIALLSRATTQFSGDGASSQPSISANGRYVAFASAATNLVPSDTNASSDIFVADLQSRTLRRASVTSAGAQASGGSFTPSISADGRYVAFASVATDLVSGDTNGDQDIFVHDLVSGTTDRVSISNTEAESDDSSFSPAISADGRVIAFDSNARNLVNGDTNNRRDVFIRDRGIGSTERMSISNVNSQVSADSFSPSISATGEYVAFSSDATTLVNSDTNAVRDIFVKRRLFASTVRVSVSSAGTQSNGASNTPAFSADGRYVAFESAATNLVAGDTNGVQDIFLRDFTGSTTERVSISPTGVEPNASCTRPHNSADGRYTSFQTAATTLVAGVGGATHAFVRDNLLGSIESASVRPDGVAGNGDCVRTALSGDGRRIAFECAASNLAPGDTNSLGDVFVAERSSFSPNLPPVALVGSEHPTVPHDGNPATNTVEVALFGGLSFDPEGEPVFFGWYNTGRVLQSSIDVFAPTLPAGEHVYHLRVMDIFGADDWATLVFRINPEPNRPPTANAGPSREVYLAQSATVAAVSLNARDSADPDGDALAYQWRDGTGADLGTTETVNLQLPLGKHTLRLRATDPYGAYDDDAAIIHVRPPLNASPFAGAGADQAVADSGNDTTPVTLNGSTSTDPEGGTLTYAWRLHGVTIATGASPTVNLEPGRHRIELTVTDPLGAAATDTVTITIGVADVTSLAVVRRLRPVAKARGEFTARVRVTNTTDGEFAGPVSLVLDGLTATKMTNEDGLTTTATGPPGKPYVNRTNAIAPGATVEFTVRAKLGSTGALPPAIRVLSGIGGR